MKLILTTFMRIFDPEVAHAWGLKEMRREFGLQNNESLPTFLSEMKITIERYQDDQNVIHHGQPAPQTWSSTWTEPYRVTAEVTW